MHPKEINVLVVNLLTNMLENSKMKGVIFRSWIQSLKVLIIKGNFNLKTIQKNLDN